MLMTGSLPAAWSSFQSMAYLNISQNKLTGAYTPFCGKSLTHHFLVDGLLLLVSMLMFTACCRDSAS